MHEFDYFVTTSDRSVVSYFYYFLTAVIALMTFFSVSHAKTSNKIIDCIVLKNININEDKIFNNSQQKQLIKPFLSKCINSVTIEKIINSISAFYIKAGYVTTKPYIMGQDVNDGIIDIEIVVGVIENIVDSKTNKTNAKIRLAFLGQVNSPLNLRNLESSLDAIKRTTSTTAKFKITPGVKNGSSIVKVEFIPVSSPFSFSLGVSGSGTLKDDNPNVSASIKLDNLFNINDILSININNSKAQEYYNSASTKSYSYSLPISDYIFSLSSFYNSYRKGLQGYNAMHLHNGKTKNLKLKIDKILARDQQNKYKLSAALNHKDTENYTVHQLTDVNSYKTTVAQVDLEHTMLKKWGSIVNTYSYYQGLDWFDARNDEYFLTDNEIDHSTTQKLQFKKYSFNYALSYQFPDNSYALKTNIHVQHTKNDLFPGDKYLSANNAWNIKSTLTKTIKLDLYKSLLQSISPYISFNHQQASCEQDNKGYCGISNILGLGLNTVSDNLNTSFSWSKAVKQTKSGSQDTMFSFNLSWKF